MTAPTHDEERLTERLHALTATIDGPAPTAAVLRRGRASVRRTRLLGATAALSVLATAGVLGAASGLLSHSARTQRPGGAAGSPQTSVAPATGHHGSKQAAKKAGKQPAVETWCNQVGPQRAREEDRRYGSTRAGYADLVIEHLDPHQLHLNKSQGGGDTTGRNCALLALDTNLGYTSPGDDGLGVVRVEVTTASASRQLHIGLWQARPPAGGWHPAASIPSGAVRAYVKEGSDDTAVVVIRADGTLVELDAERLWGNNSLTPVTHMDITVDQLLETAADPRFQLP
jgi:hypothetical protein